MAISKDKKKSLIKQYQGDLQWANTVIVLEQNAIPVNVSTNIRKEVLSWNDNMNVIRKRLFLKALEWTEYEKIDLEKLSWAVIVLYSNSESVNSLKVMNKYLKQFKKEKAKSSINFLWGWFGKKWESAEYIWELANMPTKEELISKLMRLLKYPMQSLASVLDQVATKKWEPVAEQVVEPVAETQVTTD